MAPYLDRTLVFIHGVGGALPQEQWISPLSDAMAQQGYSRPEASGVDIVTIDYREALLASDRVDLPDVTWHKPRNIAEDHAVYQTRRASVDRAVRRLKRSQPRAGLGQVDATTAHHLARLVEMAAKELRQEARLYRTDNSARARVLRRTLEQIPAHGHLVVIGHSLGSVVASDVIKRLPNDMLVDQLITIGSPLPLDQFWKFIDLIGDSFPFDRLRSWVNVFDSLDPVSAGRGIGGRHADAIDADVHFGSLARLVSNHAAEYYLGLPLVAELVGSTLYDSPTRPKSTENDPVPARVLGEDWNLYLLSSAYAFQVSATCRGSAPRWRRRFNAARHASVVKLLGDVDEHKGELSASAIAVPGQADFLDHAAALVRETWTDAELIPFAIAMLMSSPVRPYEISISTDHAEAALTSLFDRVRRPGSNVADPDFSKAVADALTDAREVMGGNSKLWAYLMLGGAAVLTMTGVGIWAAAPAGLAGAALVTSTLAAFGPGGMVGGMLTIAAASSAGSALLGAGAGQSSQDNNRASMSFASTIAKLPKEQLRATVTGWVARVIAEDNLALTTSAEQTRALLTAALVQVVNEENAHRGLESNGAHAWEERRKVLERALNWLVKNHPPAAKQTVIDALSKSDGPLIIASQDAQRAIASS